MSIRCRASKPLFDYLQVLGECFWPGTVFAHEPDEDGRCWVDSCDINHCHGDAYVDTLPSGWRSGQPARSPGLSCGDHQSAELAEQRPLSSGQAETCSLCGRGNMGCDDQPLYG